MKFRCKVLGRVTIETQGTRIEIDNSETKDMITVDNVQKVHHQFRIFTHKIKSRRTVQYTLISTGGKELMELYRQREEIKHTLIGEIIEGDMDLQNTHRKKDIGRVGQSLFESIKSVKFYALNLNDYSLN